MVETKKIKAVVLEITEKSGTKKDGNKWTLYTYKVHQKDVGNKYMTTFHVIKDVPINQEVEIEYREKPNPMKEGSFNLEIESITWDKSTVPSSGNDMSEPEFKKGYLERADISAMQLNHFIGTYCRKYAPDIAKKATDLFNSK